jgi:hypothetical protein
MRRSIYDTLTGQVVNSILLEDEAEYIPEEGYSLGPDADIGDSIINGEVIKPVVEPPISPPPTLLDQLTAIFTVLPLEAQAQFGPLAAAVFLFLDQNNPLAAQLVIQNAQVSPELEEIKSEMLSIFN